MDIPTLDAVTKYFEGLSGLANALGIATGLLMIAGLVWRFSSQTRRKVPESLSAWAQAKYGSIGRGLNEKARSTIRIAIVDDKPEDFPESYIRSLRYDLSIFQSLSLTNIDCLNKYDLVILDITNVIVEDKKSGGLEVIKRLKSLQTAPLVIAVSGKKYDPTVTEFFKLADAYLKKPVKETDLEAVLQRLLIPRVSPVGIAETMDHLLTHSVINLSDRKQLIRVLLAGLQGKQRRFNGTLDAYEPVRKQLEELTNNFQRFQNCYESS